MKRPILLGILLLTFLLGYMAAAAQVSSDQAWVQRLKEALIKSEKYGSNPDSSELAKGPLELSGVISEGVRGSATAQALVTWALRDYYKLRGQLGGNPLGASLPAQELTAKLAIVQAAQNQRIIELLESLLSATQRDQAQEKKGRVR